MDIDDPFLCAYEMPLPARLGPNLFAACFPLMKLLPARFMLERARARGVLTPSGHVVETTSGTFGLALAILAARQRFPLTLVTADTLVDERLLARLRLLGAQIEVLHDSAGTGVQDLRLETLRHLLGEEPGAFWPQQYDNPDNPLSYGKLAEWIVRNFGAVDCLVGCVGSGGSLCGTGKFLRRVFPAIRIIAVDTNSSVLFGHPAGRRLLRGLGNSIIPRNLDHRIVDEVHWVGAMQAFASARRLYRNNGLFVGPTSGAAVLVAQWIAAQTASTKIVVILPDDGHRYLDTVFNDQWLASLKGWPTDIATSPVTLSALVPHDERAWTRFQWGRRSLAGVLRSMGQGC
jgi:cysteine synthase